MRTEKGVIVVLLGTVVACGAYHLTRINEDGVIIAGPTGDDYIYNDSFESESEISEAGFILFSDDYTLYSYSTNLEYLSSKYDGATEPSVALDNTKNLIYVPRYSDGFWFVDVCDLYLNTLDYFEIPKKPISLTVDEAADVIWLTIYYYEGYNGLYKYDGSGTLLGFFPEQYGLYNLRNTGYDGSFWSSYRTDIQRSLKLINTNGDVSAECQYLPGLIIESSVVEYDNSIWVIYYSGGARTLCKVNRLGSIVFRNDGAPGFDCLGVNQNDGSVWLGNYQRNIKHLDSQGRVIFTNQWFEDYILDISVDPADNSAVVISGSRVYGSIQPSSFGEIKAMFR